MAAIAAPLRDGLVRWLRRNEPVAGGEILLHRRRIYILPTRFGLYYALMLAVMLLGAVNYANSMAFILTFLLTALGANALWQTHRNLLHLRVGCVGAAPVFAGEEAQFQLQLTNPTPRPRYALALAGHDGPLSLFALAAGARETVAVRMPAPQRGRLSAGRLRLFTRYPLGLFEAWSWLEFECTALVYPRAAASATLPAATPDDVRRGTGGRSGEEDFAGLRRYVTGDPLRRVAWKAAARSGTLLTKQFQGAQRADLWLSWNDLPNAGAEQRLSLLCRLVLDAESAGLRYGLRLPGVEYPPELGEAQRLRCLQALALFRLPA